MSVVPPVAEQLAGAGVTVVIPCHDEAQHIAEVVRGFREALPRAEILVIDNASADGTAGIARAAGATVVHEPRKGKGNAVLRGLREAADADYVVMVDGDGTYPPGRVRDLLAAAAEGADQVVGTRLTQAEAGAFPTGHGLGNRLFILLVRVLFGARTGDLFSGYRVLSRRFLRTVPLLATGFEIEAELTLQAEMRGLLVREVPVAYRPRGEGSKSKLSTFRDGYRILLAILTFFRDYRPLSCFGGLAALFALAALACGWLVVANYLATGLVLRLPLAVLAAALFILSALSLTCGAILSSINRRAAELASLIADR